MTSLSTLDPIWIKKNPKTDGNHRDYMKQYANLMCVYPTTDCEIIDIVHNLKANKSAGHDELSPRVIKSVISSIAQPLSDIFNLSLSTGVFPDKLKIAKVSPIFKADDKLSVNNYRPISVLPVFSKILEKNYV
jgi:hypothetical protein